MKSNNYEVSFHIAVDDVEAIQAIPFNRNAWASGDGANGKGNRSYIHIEICYSKSGGTRFINAEKRAAKEIALLLKKYGWTINNVKRHKDFSNKYCPHRTMDMGWSRFLNMVQAELNALNNQVQSNNDVLYKVQVGAFSNKSNAERLANELKSKGYQAIIIAVKK
ncbi:N-acetylmuramoyl-L-alanine amidase [Clostridium sp. NSJ-145]|uniref:N-acetylmuramoyl-L-alanine amidase n=1 Tax=Clostridium sp. NSJ-145 TaxID=2897777 RepID=UPI001E33C748|nr:N-acetylmuramoyl-L-alanine amidase [Clostridium sp. NSJ-145]MCD2503323.1 N-acetylmuramoyl-L-alanine amidase [Clostridium sp. NSJ-145]